MKKFTNRGRLPLFTSAAIAGLLTLSACGGSSDDATEGADGDLTPVEVGVIPIGDVASIYVGQQEGIFEEHGIDLTLTQAQGGAAIVPGVQSGDLDFGYSNVTSLVMARSQGLPIQIVATGPQTTGSADEDFAAVMVAPDSGIESVTDLEGKTLAVNTLNNIFDSVISSGLEQEGGDPEQVEFVEMAFPDMVAQLEAGNVDAISAVDPFAVMGDEAGLNRIYGPFSEPVEDLSIGGYFTNEQLVSEDPELVESFTAAMQESQALSEEDPELVREVIAEYTDMDPDILEQTTLPRFPQEHHRESLQQIIDISVETGLIQEPIELEELIIDGA
ncbi:MAG: ABC transporter substrate-binding protein [Yaniella sp.]|uniref:ABC transporter substrate-binding protein n=2 Tax=Yaniella sp. TaxID=2773929 RepID=UPI0026487237|nr:ABC transporter substrate-binding protein [Yaniella sp.]MDN5732439.1 ABC transporter substrate-binding protein [Yaniella sp.]MDN5890107.1 ABC transporter substrate-binding protein [Yaniella sp.]MDN6149347.1 ABC transporter substrate-binding protein [Yaniella sp.]MDN6173280.1 ABC transporter substrate-binding protein [Yaniella sp.]MDN6412209.1 ABC transporter substrate-binding protein [Yaniella sp.]